MYDETLSTANSAERWLSFHRWLNQKVRDMNENEIRDFSSQWPMSRQETRTGQIIRGVNDHVPDQYVNEWCQIFGYKNISPRYHPAECYKSIAEQNHDAIVKAEKRFQSSRKAMTDWRRDDYTATREF